MSTISHADTRRPESASAVQQQPSAARSVPASVPLSTSASTPAPVTLQRAWLNPGALRPSDVLRLQRTIGNRATTQLLRPVLQRKELSLGAANDPYEREADRMAVQVVAQSRIAPSTDTAGQGQRTPESATNSFRAKPLAAQVTPLRKSPPITPVAQIRRAAFAQRDANAQPIHGAEGGTVEPGVQQQIQAARGGGKPLEPNLRARLQQGFGTDLSHVRIHTGSKADKLSRSVNARAFTVGNDIFFRNGQERDLKLNAHEITHTFQQKGNTTAQRDVIQRDLGFEYAISWKPRLRLEDGTTKEYGKHHVLYRAPEFNMETDGPDIEFVLKPIKDSEGEAGVIRVYDKLEQLIRAMEMEQLLAKHFDNTDILRPPLSFLHVNEPNLEIDTGGVPISAVPQATIGVKMENIPTLFRGLSDMGNPDNEELIGMNSGTKTHASKIGRAVSYDWGPVNGKAPGAKLKGLLALVALVLNQGNTPLPGLGIPTVKYLMIIMSRTQFGHLFNQIEEEEKAYFQEDPQRFVSYVCDKLGLAADDNVISYKIHDGNTLKNYSDRRWGFGLFPGKDERITIPITRKKWLTEMTKGKDVLTAAANPITWWNKKEFEDTRGYGHRLRGLGGLGDTMDDLSDGGKGAIMEMRVMKKPIPASEWKDQAVSIFRYVRAINAHTGGAIPKYKRVNLKQEQMEEARERRLREDSHKRRTMPWG